MRNAVPISPTIGHIGSSQYTRNTEVVISTSLHPGFTVCVLYACACALQDNARPTSLRLTGDRMRAYTRPAVPYDAAVPLAYEDATWSALRSGIGASRPSPETPSGCPLSLSLFLYPGESATGTIPLYASPSPGSTWTPPLITSSPPDWPSFQHAGMRRVEIREGHARIFSVGPTVQWLIFAIHREPRAESSRRGGILIGWYAGFGTDAGALAINDHTHSLSNPRRPPSAARWMEWCLLPHRLGSTLLLSRARNIHSHHRPPPHAHRSSEGVHASARQRRIQKPPLVLSVQLKIFQGLWGGPRSSPIRCPSKSPSVRQGPGQPHVAAS